MPTMKGVDLATLLADAQARGLTVTVGPSACELLAGTSPVTSSATVPTPPDKRPRPPVRPALVAAAFEPPGRWTIPVVTASEANGREWRARSARTQDARQAVSRTMGPHLRSLAAFAEAYHAGKPVHATLTRLGGRRVDPGAVAGTLKAVEDAVCLLLGADDGDARWVPDYRQEPGGAVGVRVELAAG